MDCNDNQDTDTGPMADIIEAKQKEVGNALCKCIVAVSKMHCLLLERAATCWWLGQTICVNHEVGGTPV